MDYDFFAQGCRGGFCGAADACPLRRGLRRPAGGVCVLFFEELVELLLQLPALLRVSGGVEARPRVTDGKVEHRHRRTGFARCRDGARIPLLDSGGLPAEAQAAVGRLPADDVGALPFVARLVGPDGDAPAFELPYHFRRRSFGHYREAHFPQADGTPRLRFEVARGHFLYVGHDAAYLFGHRARHVGIDFFQMPVNAVGAVRFGHGFVDVFYEVHGAGEVPGYGWQRDFREAFDDLLFLGFVFFPGNGRNPCGGFPAHIVDVAQFARRGAEDTAPEESLTPFVCLPPHGAHHVIECYLVIKRFPRTAAPRRRERVTFVAYPLFLNYSGEHVREPRLELLLIDALVNLGPGGVGVRLDGDVAVLGIVYGFEYRVVDFRLDDKRFLPFQCRGVVLFDEASDFRGQHVIAFTQEALHSYGLDDVLQEGYSSGGVLFHPGPHHFGHGVPFLGEEELFGRVTVAEGFHQAPVAAAVYAPFVVVGMEVGGVEKRQGAGAVGAPIDFVGLLAVEFVSRLGEHGCPCVAAVHLVAATGRVYALPAEDQRYGPVVLMLHARFRDGDRGHREAPETEGVRQVLFREVMDGHKVAFRDCRFRSGKRGFAVAEADKG